MKERRGLIEWIGLLLPMGVIAVGVVVGYVRLDDMVKSNCKQFTADISRIEDAGSTVSRQNKEEIAVIKTQLSSIDRQLNSIAASQEKMMMILMRQPSNRTPTPNP